MSPASPVPKGAKSRAMRRRVGNHVSCNFYYYMKLKVSRKLKTVQNLTFLLLLPSQSVVIRLSARGELISETSILESDPPYFPVSLSALSALTTERNIVPYVRSLSSQKGLESRPELHVFRGVRADDTLMSKVPDWRRLSAGCSGTVLAQGPSDL